MPAYLPSGSIADPAPPADPDAGHPGTAALAELNTRLADRIAAYDKVLDKAEPDFRPVAAEFHALHRRHAAALAGMLREAGHDPGQDGSIFGTVDRSLIELRSWFDVVGTNLMDQLVQGEKHVLDGYGQAIDALAGRDGPRRILAGQRAGLVALLDRHTTR